MSPSTQEAAEHVLYSGMLPVVAGSESTTDGSDEADDISNTKRPTIRPTHRALDLLLFRQVNRLRTALRDGTDPALRGPEAGR